MDDELWTAVIWFAIAAGLGVYIFWNSDTWIGRYRFAFSHGVEYRDVMMAKKPHDCDFWTAPMGMKHCSYEPVTTPFRQGERRGISVTWNRVAD